MIRTHIIPCALPRSCADELNRSSGTIYTGVMVSHWRVLRQSRHWLSEGPAKRWSDTRIHAKMHAHSIDAAQEGFRQACDVTRALRKAGFAEAKFPHWPKKYRTTIWKNTAIKRRGDILELSNGRK